MNRDNELERKEFDKKVKRNIKRVILILIIIFALGFVINKIYANYKEKLDIERNRVVSSNEKILMQYIGYLNDINELIVDMICGQEVDKEYYNVFLELSSEKYRNLRDIRYNREKYDIARLENNLNYRCDFNGESNRSIRGLLLEDKLTKEQEEYLSEVYKVNNKIIEVYNKNLKKTYADGNRDENIYYELYYEGRMYYDLINRLHEAAAGNNFDMPTKLDIINEYPEKETREEEMLKKTPIEYAEIISEIITGEKAEFTVSNDFEDFEYTYKNDEAKHIRICIRENNSYLNYYDESITQGDMPEDQIDEKAEEIINAFGVDSLRLVDKEYEDYFSSRQGKTIKFYGYEYTYYVVDNEYIDLESFVTRMIILTDGTVHELQVGNLNIIDGTYKKLTPKITMDQAKSMLDDRIQKNIKSYKLIKTYDDKFIYEFEFNLYGLKLYTGVNADTGEIEFYKDTSYSGRVN